MDQNTWHGSCQDKPSSDTGRVDPETAKNPIFCLDTGRVIHALGDTGRVTQKTEFDGFLWSAIYVVFTHFRLTTDPQET